ncbi:MAG: hypothetical protein KJ574_04190, partial [Nanoarchaeota archaeon]|nr:hypothetical protein [Nanoarchaeota archaeon]
MSFLFDTGVFTETITQHISKDTLFFALEINPNFVAEVKRRLPKVKIYNDSAANIKKYLKLNKADKCDYIISTLPFTLFDNDLQQKILDEAYNNLKEGGEFLTIAYITSPYIHSGAHFQRLLKKRFKKVTKTKVEWNNFLPAFFYRCKKEGKTR